MNKTFLRIGTALAILAAPLPALAEPIHALLYKNPQCSCCEGYAAYLRENVHYTFGGFNFPATFLNLLLEVGVSRIMFSVDHPYGSMAEARAFLQQIPVSEADREAIAHGNAEKLLGL